jgi:hypothetical protein
VGRLRELFEPGEELLGLLDPALRDPELGELGRRVDASRPEVGACSPSASIPSAISQSPEAMNISAQHA